MISYDRNHVRKVKPLIHCITNPISMNACANTILAVGGKPIMAEHPREVEEITETAGGLLLNLGNLTDVRMESMQIAMKTAQKSGIPVVLDAVGVACSRLRRDYAAGLLKLGIPHLIKGNYSEILALYREEYRGKGVDADASVSIEQITNTVNELAHRYNTVILATGKTDILADGQRMRHLSNGSPQLSEITGTGCMLGALCTCYMSMQPDIEAVTVACAVLGICGELAETEKGPGSFFSNLLDRLHTISDAELRERFCMEEKGIERT